MDTSAPDTSPRRRARGTGPALVALVAVVGFGVPIGNAEAAPLSHDRARTALTSDAYETKVELLVNRRREARGLRSLRFQTCADLTAERWAARIASTGNLRHQDLGHVMADCGASYAGETLSRGRFGPQVVVRRWLRSPSHRIVMLSPRARRIGIGSSLDGSGRWVTSASFTRP